MASSRLVIWTVYDHIGNFVARKTEVDGSGIYPTPHLMVSTDLAPIRQRLAQQGLSRMPRHDENDPGIIEVWL